MAGNPLNALLRHLRRMAAASGSGTVADGQLLESFISRRDEAAFESLLGRHGPMVLGTCRRILRDPNDVDDAFQATFLVLCRKAGSIGRRESVGSWLHRVAYRVALRVKGSERRPITIDRPILDPPAPESPPELEWRELRAVLDEELNRLPEKYRAPLVLHYLEEKAVGEVAQELGCPYGTALGRLARGRSRLLARLLRRGLTLSAATLSTALARQATAGPVPLTLARSTLKAAALFGLGQAAMPGIVAPKVVALVNGVLRGILLTKLKVATGALLAAGLMVGGAFVSYSQVGAQQHEARAEGAAPANGAAAAIPPVWNERLVIYPKANANDGFHIWSAAISPDGKLIATGEATCARLLEAATGKEIRVLDQTSTGCTAFSPDGKMVATSHTATIKLWDVLSGKELASLKHGSSFAVKVRFAPDGKTVAAAGKTIRLWDVSTGQERRQLNLDAQYWLGKREVLDIAFSPDGTRLASAEAYRGIWEEGLLKLWDLGTGKEIASFTVSQGKKATAVAYASDNNTLAVRVGGGSIKLWDIATGKERLSLSSDSMCLAFSPDGKLLASAGGEVQEIRGATFRQMIGHETIPFCDVSTGKTLTSLGHDGQVLTVAFSQDGKVLAAASTKTVRLWYLESR